MTIVDKVHAAEIVTKKGKVCKFDATECMINYERILLEISTLPI
jgi:copper chaperone NosL